jgi:hypothetical protein
MLKLDLDSRHSKKYEEMNMGNNHRKEKGIKIIDPRKLTILLQVKMIPSISSLLHIAMKRILAQQGNQKQKDGTLID